MGGRAAVLGFLVLVPAMASAETFDGGQAPEAPVARVRPLTPAAKGLVADAATRSATVRSLLAAVETSDVIVMITTSNKPNTGRGDTVFVNATAAARMLLVTVSARQSADERLCVLGHELQHVTEVAADPSVVDDAGMQRLFERVGDRISKDSPWFETAAAQRVERDVRAEVAHKKG